MDGSNNQEKLFNKGYIECLFIQLMGQMAFCTMFPVMSLYAVQLGATVAVAGIITGLYSIVALVLRPFAGFISDVLNKKTLQSIGFCLSSLACYGYALSPSIAILGAFRILHAIGFSIQSTVTIAIATTMMPAARKGEGVSYFTLMQVIGNTIGPLIAVLIADAVGCRFVFLLSGLFLTGSFILSFFVPYKGERRPMGKFDINNFISLRSLPLAFAGASTSFVAGLPSTFLVLIGQERGIQGVALFFTISAIGMFVTRPIAGRLLDRKGAQVILIPSLIIEGVSCLVIAWANSLWMIIVAAVMKPFGQGVAMPSMQAQILMDEPEERSGVASSTYFLGNDIGMGLGPIVAGWITGLYGYTVSFASSTVMIIIAILFVLVWARRVRAEKAASASAASDA